MSGDCGDGVWLLLPKGAMGPTDGVLPSVKEPSLHGMRVTVNWRKGHGQMNPHGGRTGAP